MVYLRTRSLGRNPSALSGGGRNPAIKTHRPLCDNPRFFRCNQFLIRSHETVGFFAACSQSDIDSRFFQQFKAAAHHRWKWILHSDHNPRDSRSDDRIYARGRLTGMATRFKRDIQRAATSTLSGDTEGYCFSMWPAKSSMKSFPNHNVIASDNRPHHWVRLNSSFSLLGKFDGSMHENCI